MLLKIEEPSEIKEETQNELPIFGIDFGTTNSLIGMVVNDEVRFFGDEFQKQLHKSVVAFDEFGEVCAVCNKADFFDYEQKIYSIKRLLGRGFEDVKNEKFDFEIIQEQENSQNFKIKIGKKTYLPQEIASFIFKYLKDLALKNCGFKDALNQEFRAVITIPAYFDEAAKNAVKFAAKLAGIEVVRIVSEPSAAAIAYGLDNNQQGTYLVYDLGGGTFDVSVLKINQGVFKVLGVSGNNQLGGDDFDVILANLIKEKILKIADLKEENKIFNNYFFKKFAKKIKEEFNKKNEILLQEILENQAFLSLKNIFKENFQKISEIKINKKEFEEKISSKINLTIEIVRNLIEELELSIQDIQGLILVGGSTRLEIIKEKLRENFGLNIKIYTNLDPDFVVAQGAVLQAFNLSGKGKSLLLDVLPLSLGIEMMGGIVDKIIPRNTTIPASYAKEFTTYADNQTAIKFKIVQGEREFAKDCRELAEFEVKKIPPMRAGLARVLVIFKVDADGLLTITAEEKITQEKQEIVVKPTFGLDENKIKEMLLDSLQNSKIDIEKRLLTQAINEAKQNIYFVKRDLEQYSNMISKKEMELIEAKVKDLEEILADENSARDKIVNSQKELEEASKNFVLKKMDATLQEYLGKKIDEV